MAGRSLFNPKLTMPDGTVIEGDTKEELETAIEVWKSAQGGEGLGGGGLGGGGLGGGGRFGGRISLGGAREPRKRVGRERRKKKKEKKLPQWMDPSYLEGMEGKPVSRFQGSALGGALGGFRGYLRPEVARRVWAEERTHSEVLTDLGMDFIQASTALGEIRVAFALMYEEQDELETARSLQDPKTPIPRQDRGSKKQKMALRIVKAVLAGEDSPLDVTAFPKTWTPWMAEDNPRRRPSYNVTRIYFWGPSYEQSDVFIADNRPGWEDAYDQMVTATGMDATGFIEVAGARNNGALANPRYDIPSSFPHSDWTWAPEPKLANWTSYPQYSYDQFYRPNTERVSWTGEGVSSTSGTVATNNPGADCPTCGAYAGEQCITNSGRPTRPHKARRNAVGRSYPKGLYDYYSFFEEHKDDRGRSAGWGARIPAGEYIVSIRAGVGPASLVPRVYSTPGEVMPSPLDYTEYEVALFDPTKKDEYGRAKLVEVATIGGAEPVTRDPVLRRYFSYFTEGSAAAYVPANVVAQLLADLGGSPARRNPTEIPASAWPAKKVEWPVAKNAGPFLPEMFPYGQGGRPYTYAMNNPAPSIDWYEEPGERWSESRKKYVPTTYMKSRSKVVLRHKGPVTIYAVVDAGFGEPLRRFEMRDITVTMKPYAQYDGTYEIRGKMKGGRRERVLNVGYTYTDRALVILEGYDVGAASSGRREYAGTMGRVMGQAPGDFKVVDLPGIRASGKVLFDARGGEVVESVGSEWERRTTYSNPISQGDREAAARAGGTLSGGTGWPVKVPHWSADKNRRQAIIALQYMTRGFGNRSEYGKYLRRLAAIYPPESGANRDIWTFYRNNRDDIKKWYPRAPTVATLRKVKPIRVRKPKRRAAPRRAAANPLPWAEPVEVVRTKRKWKLPNDAVLYYKGKSYSIGKGEHPGRHGDVGYAIPTWIAFRLLTKGRGITLKQLSGTYAGLKRRALAASRRSR
jgi:hypothetical protein